jgi:hypothetical protein
MQPVNLAAERFTGFFFLGLGGFLCALNFYLSCLRYALYRLRGRTEEYRHSSGFPFLGSVMVVFILIRPPAFHFPLWAVLTGLVLATIDTGGPHWFIASQIYYYSIKKARTPGLPR